VGQIAHQGDVFGQGGDFGVTKLAEIGEGPFERTAEQVLQGSRGVPRRRGDELGSDRPESAGYRDREEGVHARGEGAGRDKALRLEAGKIAGLFIISRDFVPDGMMMPLLAVLAEAGTDEKERLGGEFEGAAPAPGIVGGELGGRGELNADRFEGGQLRAGEGKGERVGGGFEGRAVRPTCGS